ncbi:MAG: nucleoside triphosphate pyrophosphohydrolase [Bacillota bacterium]|nr:nucleoside triphosphate pyrophosphohydrolase [Bacillota bacterium]
MGQILVIGLGSTDLSAISEKILAELRTKKKIFLRTKAHEAAKDLQADFDLFSLDSFYEEEEDLERVDEKIASFLEKEAEKEDLIYLVPGSPFVLERAVSLMIEKGLDLDFINNQSAADVVFASLKHITSGYRTLAAKDVSIHNIDYSLDLLIQEIDHEYILDELILKLLDSYPSSAKFSLIKNGGLDSQEIYTDRLENYQRKIIPNHQTSLLVYKADQERYTFSDLLQTTDILRGPEGCPWDMEKTHEDLRQDLLEEAYEAVYAINNNDLDNLCEELGDLLFQVSLHAQIAYENGDFSINDVINSINSKLIYRHPHVFGDFKLDKSSKVLQNWDSIKYSSRDINKFWQRLDSSKGNPSTLWAYDIIDKVTRIGFDWSNKEEILEKVKEEYREVVGALNSPTDLEEELGDLLFTVVNLCHYLGYEAELLLTSACHKFIARFKFMEDLAEDQGLDIKEIGKDKLEEFWQVSKNKLEVI